MARYQRNNIIFRIASSDAIGKFKCMQAGAFVELARKDLKFNDIAKEIVLLEYDRFSQWLLRIERICLVAQEGQMSHSLRQAIQESYREEIRVVENVLDAHPDVFCSKAVAFTRIIHEYATALMIDRMNESMNEPVDRAFEQVVMLVTNYLQHILMSMHEFNNNQLLKRKPPFLCLVDSIVNINTGDDRFQTMILRANYFKHLGCGNTFALKNYASHDMFEDARDFLAKSDINLIREIADENKPEIDSPAYAIDQESTITSHP